jgi:hypothetical protein
MRETTKRQILAATMTTAIGLAALVPVRAQEKSLGSAVVYPIVYCRNSGTKGSRETAVASVREVLQKAGYTLVSGTVAANTWTRLRIPQPSTGHPAKMDETVRFGKAVKARYVVAPEFDFHSRSKWVDLGPKTISTVTVNVRITDTRKAKVVYTRLNVQARSDEKFDPVKAGADILLTPLVSVVSGGPKTPHEQRAAQIAVSKALKDWVKQQQRSQRPSGHTILSYDLDGRPERVTARPHTVAQPVWI